MRKEDAAGGRGVAASSRPRHLWNPGVGGPGQVINYFFVCSSLLFSYGPGQIEPDIIESQQRAILYIGNEYAPPWGEGLVAVIWEENLEREKGK